MDDGDAGEERGQTGHDEVEDGEQPKVFEILFHSLPSRPVAGFQGSAAILPGPRPASQRRFGWKRRSGTRRSSVIWLKELRLVPRSFIAAETFVGRPAFHPEGVTACSQGCRSDTPRRKLEIDPGGVAARRDEEGFLRPLRGRRTTFNGCPGRHGSTPGYRLSPLRGEMQASRRTFRPQWTTGLKSKPATDGSPKTEKRNPKTSNIPHA